MRIRPSGILGCAIALAMSFATAQADDAIGQVKTKTGTVSVQRHGKTQPLAIGEHVFQSDLISTAKGASVGLTFADNSMMSLGPNSQLALDQFRFDTTTHVGVFNTSLSKGTLAVKSGQIVQQTPEAMHVKTPAALLGVRGTEFVVRADGKS
ncbi:MAG TPA: FecR domain-containing protein [Rhizomicrobium sp.]|nr:FecR domain-containing protein [Rhizomicrobium sp.]